MGRARRRRVPPLRICRGAQADLEDGAIPPFVADQPHLLNHAQLLQQQLEEAHLRRVDEWPRVQRGARSLMPVRRAPRRTGRKRPVERLAVGAERVGEAPMELKQRRRKLIALPAAAPAGIGGGR